MVERGRDGAESGEKSKKKQCVLLRTYGCQMNVRDSEVICGLLKKEGYQIIGDSDKADIILLNTCFVRQHAEDKVWSEIGRIAKLGTRYTVDGTKRLIIGLIGCMAQAHKEKVFERAPKVDFVVGPSDIHKIPEIIRRVTSQDLLELKIWETDGGIRPEEIYHTGFYQDKEHAYVVISEGCSNYCSYCVVPYVRGPLHNRNYKDILKEIEQAADKGINKVTLLGQNVNAYEFVVCSSGFKVDFIELLKMVNNIRGLKEFSFITSHPKDTSVELFKAMASLEKLKKYLHLPVQSGSDRILKLMNRGYTKKFYLDLADKYRKIIKGGPLTTDIIVGFPTETKEDFQETYDLVKKVEFNAAFIFKYSPRPNTQAASLADDLAKEEKEHRHALVLELQKKISKKK